VEACIGRDSATRSCCRLISTEGSSTTMRLTTMLSSLGKSAPIGGRSAGRSWLEEGFVRVEVEVPVCTGLRRECAEEESVSAADLCAASAVAVCPRWLLEVRGGGGKGGPEAAALEVVLAVIGTVGELFVDGGKGRARGVVMVEALDSAGE
jgi:hypothetical protein